MTLVSLATTDYTLLLYISTLELSKLIVREMISLFDRDQFVATVPHLPSFDSAQDPSSAKNPVTSQRPVLIFLMSDREAILAAIESRRRKTVELPSPIPAPTSNLSTPIPTYSYLDKDHDRRQEFRRLMDPGITRPNSREVAYEAIKVRPCPRSSSVHEGLTVY